MKKLALSLFVGLIMLTGCVSQSTEPTTAASETQAPAAETETPVAEVRPADCSELSFIAPTLPADAPGYLQLDISTGLHVTANPQEVDLESYRLKVSGLVDTPLALTYAELRCMPEVSDDPLLVCEGYFEDKANWTGVSLSYILNLAGVQPAASEITLISADGYQMFMNLNEAMQESNFLAYEVNGEMLPVLHGFPLRAVFPGQNGFNWVKWLVEIQVQ